MLNFPKHFTDAFNIGDYDGVSKVWKHDIIRLRYIFSNKFFIYTWIKLFKYGVVHWSIYVIIYIFVYFSNFSFLYHYIFLFQLIVIIIEVNKLSSIIIHTSSTSRCAVWLLLLSVVFCYILCDLFIILGSCVVFVRVLITIFFQLVLKKLLTDWLIDCLTNWLTDWQTDWPTDCLTDWLTDWLTA